MRNPSQLDKQLQRFAREYVKSKDDKLIDNDDLVNWILENKRWEPGPKRIRMMLRTDVSHALSEERFTDNDLRRVKKYHLIKRRKGATQITLWSPIEYMQFTDMKLSLQVRRKDLVARAVQINNDQNHYNNYVNKSEPIQTSFNLTNDVLEAEITLAADRRASSNGSKQPSGRSPASVPGSDSQPLTSRP